MSIDTPGAGDTIAGPVTVERVETNGTQTLVALAVGDHRSVVALPADPSLAALQSLLPRGLARRVQSEVELARESASTDEADGTDAPASKYRAGLEDDDALAQEVPYNG